MTAIDTNKLNEKIARWLGWKQTKYYEDLYWENPFENRGLKLVFNLPDYVNDFNIQNRDIYPKLQNLPESQFGDTSFGIEWQSEIRYYYAYIKMLDEYNAFNKSPSVAFALAVEHILIH